MLHAAAVRSKMSAQRMWPVLTGGVARPTFEALMGSLLKSCVGGGRRRRLRTSTAVGLEGSLLAGHVSCV
jgi:hypothetical protein